MVKIDIPVKVKIIRTNNRNTEPQFQALEEDRDGNPVLPVLVGELSDGEIKEDMNILK